MAKAKITLGDNGPRSFHGRGRHFLRGQSVVTSDPGDILYFQGQSGFHVEMLDGAPPKAAPAPPAPEPEPETEAPAGVGSEELAAMTKNQLMSYAEENGLNVKLDKQMNKQTMIERIMAAAAGDDPEDESEGDEGDDEDEGDED